MAPFTEPSTDIGFAQPPDNILGETVNYGYDMWNRLTSASATNGNWGEQYTFDNFGNLTGKTPTAGSAPALSASYNLSTNQQAGASYDANGNPTPSNGFGGPTYTWNVENRLSQSTAITGIYQPTSYAYDPWGRRVWTETAGASGGPNTGEIYFYGATGQKLETYAYSWGSGGFASGLAGINIYFGGKLLQSKGVRLGSVRANSNGESMSYWPYGEERTNTANDREKFGTYMRDGVGQDYAEQRYYNANMGAFWSPDPAGIKTANPKNPSSWNRYGYTKGNPIGRFDRHGLDDCDPDDNEECQESYCEINPEDPICNPLPTGGGGGPTPQKPAKPKKRPLPAYLVVTDDCYVGGSIAAGDAERDITYQLYGSNGQPFTSAIVIENRTGDLPIGGATSSGSPGGEFDDTQSILLGKSIQVVYQTFTATTIYNYVNPPVTVPVYVQGFGGDFGTLGIYKTSTAVYINGNSGLNASGQPNEICHN